MKARTLSLLSMVLLLATLLPFTASAAPPEAVAYVAQMQGIATARSGGKAPRPLARFSPLFSGEVVTVRRGGRVIVRFLGSGQTITLMAATPGATRRIAPPQVKAPDARARLLRELAEDQRAALSKAIRSARKAVRQVGRPLIVDALLPRGKVLSGTPIFRWQMQQPGPVQVSVFDGGDRPLWRAEGVPGGSVVLPAQDRPLRPGIEYHWVVYIPGTQNNAEQGFTVVPPEVQADIARRLTALEEFSFTDEEERRLMRATIYQKYGLYTSVIEELRALSGAKVSPLVFAVLADAWGAVGHFGMQADARRAMSQKGLTFVAQWEVASR